MQSPCFNCNCCQNSHEDQNPTSKISIIITCHREFIDAVASSIQPNSQFTNHECLPSCVELFASLKEAYPHYIQTNLADEIRSHEYYHLSISKHVCLDYIGNGLFSYYQQQKMKYNPTTNDSIASSSSAPPPPTPQFAPLDEPFFNISYKSVSLSTQLLYGGEESDLERKMRKRIMKYMNISKHDYSMVFTANQSSAFKLLAESYPFESNRNLLTVYDHENEAVEGMINSAKKKGAKVVSAEFSWPNLRINSRKLRKTLGVKKKKRGLFVFPLQSKVTGTRYSYQWMNIAQENGWHVVFEASALGPKDMETLGLSIFQPDFLICNFFKVFGENPSGFCCLFVKNSGISHLNKSFTSLGIIRLVSVDEKSFEDKIASSSSSSTSSESHQENSAEFQENNQVSDQENSAAGFQEIKQVSDQEPKKITTLFEILNWGKKSNKKTLSRTNMSSDELECRGLDHADKLGLILTSSRARYLINWLINALTRLQHPHTEDIHHPLVKIYGPQIHFNRGPAVAFNVFDWKGQKIDPKLVQKLADRNNISLSCAFLQHIWFSKMYDDEKKTILESTQRSGDDNNNNIKKGKLNFGVSVISVSIGMMTNFEDLYKLWSFIARFLDADFVEKERWRYKALNQTTIEV